jgi:hypothetical protein
MKLKPRSASSSWGKRPQIQQEAVYLAQQAAFIQIGGDAGEGTVHDFEAGILDLGRLGNGLGIPIDGDQPAVGAKLLENETRGDHPGQRYRRRRYRPA